MKKIDKTQLKIISSWILHNPRDMAKIIKTDKIGISIGLFLCFSLLFNAYQVGHPPQSVLVTYNPGTSMTTNDSVRTPLFALSKPINSLPIIENWITQASENIFSFDFTDISEHYNSIRPYFTNDGWESFIKAMDDEYSIQNAVIKNKNISKAVVSNKPVLSKLPSDAPIDKTRKHWIIQVPMLITLSSGNRTIVVDRIFEFDIVEDNLSIYGRGISSVKSD